mmetsp:Transcript_72497/g.120907  ORF Transcript_72497/g.120907 Transcript_72497/m.120907 type:complete len:173 (+) Transcript_72497:113-631(+)
MAFQSILFMVWWLAPLLITAQASEKPVWLSDRHSTCHSDGVCHKTRPCFDKIGEACSGERGFLDPKCGQKIQAVLSYDPICTDIEATSSNLLAQCSYCVGHSSKKRCRFKWNPEKQGCEAGGQCAACYVCSISLLTSSPECLPPKTAARQCQRCENCRHCASVRNKGSRLFG